MKATAAGIAVGREGVEPGTAGVSEAEEFRDLVEGFAGGVVEGAAYVAVGPDAVVLAGEIEVGVAAGDDEGEDGVAGEGAAGVHEDGRGCGLRGD